MEGLTKKKKNETQTGITGNQSRFNGFHFMIVFRILLVLFKRLEYVCTLMSHVNVIRPRNAVKTKRRNSL